MPQTVERPLTQAWAALVLSRLLSTYAILQGLTVALYGPDRWATSPALQPALEVPGQTATWGATLLLAGALALAGSLTGRDAWTALGHSLAALWSMFFAVSMARFLLPDAAAPTTGVFVYGVEAAVFITLAVAAWRIR